MGDGMDANDLLTTKSFVLRMDQVVELHALAKEVEVSLSVLIRSVVDMFLEAVREGVGENIS